MPARRRAAERRRAEAGRSRGSRPRKKRSGRPRPPDPSDQPDTVTRFVQPYDAVKSYLCPGCQQEIPPGMGHLVAVPPDAPDLRRHWHRGCWANRSSRR